MGYSNRIGFIPKRVYNKIKRLSYDDLMKFYNVEKEEYEDKPHLSISDIIEELHEFGKYCDFNFENVKIKKFFTNKETFEYYDSDHEFYVVNKDFLKYIIEHYTEKVKKYYSDMIDPFFSGKYGENACDFLNSVKTEYRDPDNYHTFDFSKITQEQQTALFKIINHIRDFGLEWNCLTPYDLEKGLEVTKSWKYEYNVFELVRIYKSFDWKRNVMVYYGW